MEAYTGIVQGLRTTPSELEQLGQEVPNMLALIDLIATSSSPDSLIGAAAGLIGMLSKAFVVSRKLDNTIKEVTL